MSKKYLLALLHMLIVLPSISGFRNLSEIHYRFTTCGAAGRNGPSFSACASEYTRSNSPIVGSGNPNSNLLFQFGQDTYRGAQGFRVPKSGLYNITVAGAAGGRGICSIDSGKGLVWRGQVNLTEEDNLLILVGQKGVGPCDVRPDMNLCQDPPIFMNQTSSCFANQWIDWLNITLFSDSFDLEVNRNYSGGGGGGGASMIRRQNRTTGVFDNLPLVIAGGGGGSSANLSFDFFSEFGIPPPQGLENANELELYTEFINAKATRYDNYIFNTDYRFIGVRGYIREAGPPGLRAGAGGGWSTAASGINIDGEFLDVEQNFAEGGFDCGRQIDGANAQVAIQNLDGGFGGGGGQCGGGGAGGGYTGGSIFGYSINLPGGGGYFYNPSMNNITETIATSDGDGYVDLVLANCGCANVCVIVEDTFRCECPNDTTLAPDEFDCYEVTLQPLTEGSGVVLMSESDDIILTPLYLNQSYLLYGASATLTLGEFVVEPDHHEVGENETDTDSLSNSTVFIQLDDITNHTHSNLESCVLFFLGANAEIVLTSNIIIGHHGIAKVFYIIQENQDTTDLKESDEYKSFLDRSTLVTGALLVSHSGGCAVEDNIIELTVSTIRPSNAADAAVTDDSDTITQNIQTGLYNELVELHFRSKILAAVTPTQSEPSAGTQSGPSINDTTDANDIKSVPHFYSVVIIPLGIAILVVLGAIIFIVAILCVRGKSHLKNKKLSPSESMIRPLYKRTSGSNLNSNSSGMSTNSAYASHWSQTPVVFVNEQYDGAAPRYIKNRNDSESHEYESISYNEYDERGSPQPSSPSNPHGQTLSAPSFRRGTAITESAKMFDTQYGISAPMHDFTSYNKQRITDSFENDWEYPRNKLIYLRELGEGQFGKVLLMRAQGIANYPQPIPVAVKTLSTRDPTMIEKFMEEAKLMKKCSHPNIVSLLGVSSHSVSDDSAPLMILEYMPYGDLQSFLESNRPEEGKETDTSTQIGPAHFFSFARDIAEALEFLESVKHVHRDIAARNCLVGPGLQVKLADFGLARGVDDKDYYRVKGKAVLPVRWLAPESLLYGVFTTASDVWSYGVLLWEIVTYGKIPLSELETEEIIEKAHTQELFHPRPENCPEDFYTVMSKCHRYCPGERMVFEQIIEAFSKHNIDSIFEGSVKV